MEPSRYGDFLVFNCIFNSLLFLIICGLLPIWIILLLISWPMLCVFIPLIRFITGVYCTTQSEQQQQQFLITIFNGKINVLYCIVLHCIVLHCIALCTYMFCCRIHTMLRIRTWFVCLISND